MENTLFSLVPQMPEPSRAPRPSGQMSIHDTTIYLSKEMVEAMGSPIRAYAQFEPLMDSFIVYPYPAEPAKELRYKGRGGAYMSWKEKAEEFRSILNFDKNQQYATFTKGEKRNDCWLFYRRDVQIYDKRAEGGRA